MIKFACPGCSKRIGVPEQYVDKKVRCPSCSTVAVVPRPVVEPEPEVKMELVPEPDDAPVWTDDLLGGNADNDGYGFEGDEEGSFCRYCDAKLSANAVLCVNCGHYVNDAKAAQTQVEDDDDDFDDEDVVEAEAGAGGKKRKKAKAPRTYRADVPQLNSPLIAIFAGLGAALACALVWGFIAKLTTMEFGFVAIVLGICVGVAMRFAVVQRGKLIGFLAVMIAIGGILMGKGFVAKWCVLPELEEIIQETRDELKNDPTEELLNQAADNPEVVAIAVALYYADEGYVSRAAANDLTTFYLQEVEPTTPVEDYENSRTLVDQALAEWTPREKKDVVKLVWPQIWEIVEKAIMDNAPVESIKFGLAYAATFGIMDILWFILAGYSACKAVTTD